MKQKQHALNPQKSVCPAPPQKKKKKKKKSISTFFFTTNLYKHLKSIQHGFRCHFINFYNFTSPQQPISNNQNVTHATKSPQHRPVISSPRPKQRLPLDQACSLPQLKRHIGAFYGRPRAPVTHQTPFFCRGLNRHAKV